MDEGPDDEILRVEGFVVDAKGRWNKTSTVLMVAAKPSPPPLEKKSYIKYQKMLHDLPCKKKSVFHGK